MNRLKDAGNAAFAAMAQNLIEALAPRIAHSREEAASMDAAGKTPIWCLADPLNPCWDEQRPRSAADGPLRHWAGGEACEECRIRHAFAACNVETPSDSEKAAAYYKSGIVHGAPPYVPSRVKLHSRVRGDGPFAGTFADAGEHDCDSNLWGAISVRATNGQMLGVKPAEFDVVAWRPNAAIETLAPDQAIDERTEPAESQRFRI